MPGYNFLLGPRRLPVELYANIVSTIAKIAVAYLPRKDVIIANGEMYRSPQRYFLVHLNTSPRLRNILKHGFHFAAAQIMYGQPYQIRAEEPAFQPPFFHAC